MCQVVPYPSVPRDWLKMWQVTLANAAQWAGHPEVAKWASRSRLDAIGAARRGLDPADPRRREFNRQFGGSAVEAALKIPQLLTRVDDNEHVEGPRPLEKRRPLGSTRQRECRRQTAIRRRRLPAENHSTTTNPRAADQADRPRRRAEHARALQSRIALLEVAVARPRYFRLSYLRLGDGMRGLTSIAVVATVDSRPGPCDRIGRAAALTSDGRGELGLLVEDQLSGTRNRHDDAGRPEETPSILNEPLCCVRDWGENRWIW